MRDQVLNIYQGVSEYKLVLFKPTTIYQGVYTNLRSAISIETCFSEIQQ
jgi:hypothetical protein